MPIVGERRRGSTAVSIAVHVLIVWLLVMPFTSNMGNVIERPQGAGGLGPAGGGGGGHLGTGGVREHLQYVEVAPAPTSPTATTPAVVVPTPVPPPPKVVPPITPPVVTPKPAPTILPNTVAAAPLPAAPSPQATSVVPGSGGGTGNDGSAGSGPGSGGGVGSGVGTGRGSATGPGTGGGVQANYPPTPTELFIPPLPMPDKVRGFHLVAEYDVDETGKVLSFTFTPTRDGDYNKRLRDVLKSFKFRPGTTPDGKPIRMKAQIVYDF